MKVFTKIVAAAILSLAALGIMSCDMLQNTGRTGATRLILRKLMMKQQ